MNHANRRLPLALILLTLTLGASCGCNKSSDAERTWGSLPESPGSASAGSLDSGASFRVKLVGTISAESAAVGDAWHGTMAENVEGHDKCVIPAGTEISGVVTGAAGAGRGSRAMLDLAVRGILVNCREVALMACGEKVIAGSIHARNLGATDTGAVSGYQRRTIVLRPGTVMDFVVNETVAILR